MPALSSGLLLCDTRRRAVRRLRRRHLPERHRTIGLCVLSSGGGSERPGRVSLRRVRAWRLPGRAQRQVLPCVWQRHVLAGRRVRLCRVRRRQVPERLATDSVQEVSDRHLLAAAGGRLLTLRAGKLPKRVGDVCVHGLSRRHMDVRERRVGVCQMPCRQGLRGDRGGL